MAFISTRENHVRALFVYYPPGVSVWSEWGPNGTQNAFRLPWQFYHTGAASILGDIRRTNYRVHQAIMLIFNVNEAKLSI